MRSVRQEPDFDDRPLRRPRREHAMGDAGRTVTTAERRPGKARKVRAPLTDIWLVRTAIATPMTVATIAFLAVAVFAGLIAGGHLSFGGSSSTTDRPQLASADPSSSWFPISDINFSGQSHTSPVDLLAAVAMKPGDDMLDANPAAIRAQVEALSWVDSAQVARLWPATIQVQIVEKEPYAIWQSKGVLWLIDKKGQTITKDDVADFAGLPMVVGEGAPAHAPELIDILKRFPMIQHATKAAVRVGDRRWDLHLKSGIEVRLPEDGIEDALHRLTTLEQEQKIFERDIESVDLRLPDRLVIRPRGGVSDPVAKGQST